MPRNCWICGEIADSAEHMVKASDLRAIFGRFNNKAPVYRHSKATQNELVPGPKSDKVKFAPSLCQHCNNARTQAHDKAWEKLSEQVRARHPALTTNSRLPLKEIFSSNVTNEMKNVHLFFVKLLGCYAVEYGVPLPIAHFGLCIRNEVVQPNIELTFVHIQPKTSKYQILVGNIDALNVGGKTVSAIWFYIVGTLGVLVSYKEPGHPRLNKFRGWHPSTINPSICLK